MQEEEEEGENARARADTGIVQATTAREKRQIMQVTRREREK